MQVRPAEGAQALPAVGPLCCPPHANCGPGGCHPPERAHRVQGAGVCFTVTTGHRILQGPGALVLVMA
jgi:hypothetical protein